MWMHRLALVLCASTISANFASTSWHLGTLVAGLRLFNALLLPVIHVSQQPFQAQTKVFVFICCFGSLCQFLQTLLINSKCRHHLIIDVFFFFFAALSTFWACVELSTDMYPSSLLFSDEVPAGCETCRWSAGIGMSASSGQQTSLSLYDVGRFTRCSKLYRVVAIAPQGALFAL